MTDLPKLPEAVACIRTEHLTVLDECVLWPAHCFDERNDTLIYTADQMREYAAQVAAAEFYGLLSLLADIRKAAGDPTGKLMQSELVEMIHKTREERDDLISELAACQDAFPLFSDI